MEENELRKTMQMPTVLRKGKMMASNNSTVDFDTIYKDELQLIKKHRANRKLANKEDVQSSLFGLALSGGGIRSASFGLGVLQALAKRDILKKVDYLSTVSGGGYIGSALTWFLHKKWKIADGEEKNYGLDPKDFPFGKPDKGARNSEENVILDFIRQHGNYLDPGHGLNTFSLLAVGIRSMILSLAVYFPLLCAVFSLFLFLGLFGFDGSKTIPLLLNLSITVTRNANWLIWLSVLLGCAFIGISIVYSWITTLAGKKFVGTYPFRICFQKWMGRLLYILAGLLITGSLPYTKLLLKEVALYVASGSVALGISGALFRFLMEQRNVKSTEGLLPNLFVLITSALLLYGILLTGYITAEWIIGNSHFTLLFFSTTIALITGFAVNLNYVSLHRMYRDRLAETFLPNLSTVREKKWKPATEANVAMISDMCGDDTPGPYHLLNTNVILVDSLNSKFRGRGGDNFIISPHFCGSYATGWSTTNEFINGHMTLATAMAISGAAINPHTGVAGKGPTRNRFVSFLMTMLNLRLGYWIQNPGKKLFKIIPPNYFQPGLKGLLGFGFNEESYYVELSDGGHFDNTGLYELIQRKAKIIIISDGSADPNCNFDDLANAVEKVRVDFGVNIKFDDHETNIEQMMPGSAGNSIFQKKYTLAKRGYAIGTIEYPDSKPGTIYYVKTILTENMPDDIYSYKSANPSFPDQSTTDQFFDETQFEAYRELGYRLAISMIEYDKQHKNVLQ